jgi:hypothetical protein
VIAIVLQVAPASWALAGASLGEAIILVAAWVVAMRGLRALAAQKSTRAKPQQAAKPPMDQDRGALMPLMMKSN